LRRVERQQGKEGITAAVACASVMHSLWALNMSKWWLFSSALDQILRRMDDEDDDDGNDAGGMNLLGVNLAGYEAKYKSYQREPGQVTTPPIP
jgi:hypothetical protein